MLSQEERALYYFRVTDVWKRFCEDHLELFDLTSKEYSLLLDSNLIELEEVIEYKVQVIDRISELEAIRSEIIVEINEKTNNKINNVTDLLLFMKEYEVENNLGHLHRFNGILIDVIEKIQEQNKRNQLYLNKALKNIQELRETATGEKKYETYTKSGATTRNVQSRG